MVYSDWEKIRMAFINLRKIGWFAEMEFKCCEPCAWWNLDYEPEKAVFYPLANSFVFDKYGNLAKTLLLNWRNSNLDDPNEVIVALEREGLKVSYEGSYIEVLNT